MTAVIVNPQSSDGYVTDGNQMKQSLKYRGFQKLLVVF